MDQISTFIFTLKSMKMKITLSFEQMTLKCSIDGSAGGIQTLFLTCSTTHIYWQRRVYYYIQCSVRICQLQVPALMKVIRGSGIISFKRYHSLRIYQPLSSVGPRVWWSDVREWCGSRNFLTANPRFSCFYDMAQNHVARQDLPAATLSIQEQYRLLQTLDVDSCVDWGQVRRWMEA